MGLSLPSRRVIRILDELVAVHGCPSAFRVDNGTDTGSIPERDWAIRTSPSLSSKVRPLPDGPAKQPSIEPQEAHFRGRCADGSGVERSVEPDEDASRVKPSRPGAYQWAELMRRTFGLDVLACPRCGGRLRLVALIEQASVVQRILRHLGLPTEVPEPRPARAPPRRLETLTDEPRDAPDFDAAW
jgi:hypothetical protein